MQNVRLAQKLDAYQWWIRISPCKLHKPSSRWKHDTLPSNFQQPNIRAREVDFIEDDVQYRGHSRKYWPGKPVHHSWHGQPTHLLQHREQSWESTRAIHASSSKHKILDGSFEELNLRRIIDKSREVLKEHNFSFEKNQQKSLWHTDPRTTYS